MENKKADRPKEESSLLDKYYIKTLGNKNNSHHKPVNRPEELLPESLFGTHHIIKEASPKLLESARLSTPVLTALDLLSNTGATNSLGQGERVQVDGVVIDDLAHGAGGHVGTVTGDGVDHWLHGWGGGRCMSPD